MSTNDTAIITKITDLKELIRMQEELTAEIDALKDQIKAFMGTETELVAGPYKATYKDVSSTKLDTKAVKAAFPAEALAPYMVTSTSRRFTLN